MKKVIAFLAFAFFSLCLHPLVFAGDIEATLTTADGSTTFDVEDSTGTNAVAQVDSDGNTVIKGGVRLDASGTENTTAETLIVDGSIGVGATPTAALHLKAGTATAGTAPIKLTTGINLGTPEAGTLEYDGSELYFTPSATQLIIGYASGDVWTGVHDAGGATSFELPNSAAPTTDAAGEIALDTTITDHQPFWQYYDGGENMSVIAIDTAELPAADNEIIKYDAATDKFVLEADAGGSQNFFWTLEPQTAKLPTSNPAAIDAGNNRWRLLFDASTAESATWEGVLRPYNGGTLNAKLFYTMVSATTDEVNWLVSIDCISDGDSSDVDTESFGAADSLTATVPGTAGYLDVLTDSSLAGDSCAQDDMIIVKVTTDATDATNDDATGDREFRKVIIYES